MVIHESMSSNRISHSEKVGCIYKTSYCTSSSGICQRVISGVFSDSLHYSTLSARCCPTYTVFAFPQRKMAKHHPDLVMCLKQPGTSIGRLCEKCTWKMRDNMRFLCMIIKISIFGLTASFLFLLFFYVQVMEYVVFATPS